MICSRTSSDRPHDRHNLVISDLNHPRDGLFYVDGEFSHFLGLDGVGYGGMNGGYLGNIRNFESSFDVHSVAHCGRFKFKN
jgi:hypothetical protein